MKVTGTYSSSAEGKNTEGLRRAKNPVHNYSSSAEDKKPNKGSDKKQPVYCLPGRNRKKSGTQRILGSVYKIPVPVFMNIK